MNRTDFCKSLAEYSDGFSDATSVFLTEEWFTSFLEHVVGASDTVHTVASKTASGVYCSMLPIWNQGGVAGFPRMWHSLSNYYSGYFRPLLNSRTVPLSTSIDGIASLLLMLPKWDLLKLEPYDQTDPVWQQVKSSFQANRFLIQEYFCYGNWYMKRAGRTYIDYLQMRPGRVRSTINRKARKFTKIVGARIEIVVSPSKVDAAMDAYEAVYSNSWKCTESHPAFIRDFAHKAAEKGWLRLGVAYIGEAPIAAQIWFVYKGTASIFKLAYDENHQALSIGTLLTATLFEHVLDVDQVEEIDYLSGDDGYKKEWMEQRRERFGMLIFNRTTLRGWLMALRHIAGHAVKKIITNPTNL